VIWKDKSNATPLNHRPVSREILHPEIAKYHSKLSKTRRIELRDRIKKKVGEISEKIQKGIEEEKESMDGKNVFHPNANAQRAHSQMLVRLQRTMQPNQIQELVLREMIRDDGRDLTDAEIENLEVRFGKMFQGTAFGNILEVKKEESLSPRVSLIQELEKRGVSVEDVLSGEGEEEGQEEIEKTISQLKDR